MFLVAWFVKICRNSYLKFLFKPFLAEHFRFLETAGFLVVYMKPRFGLKLTNEVMVSSYFDLEGEENTLQILKALRSRRIRVTQRTFKTTEEFIEFAQDNPVLRENTWVKNYLAYPEVVNYRDDFFLTSI